MGFAPTVDQRLSRRTEKCGLVALLRSKLWAYPAAIAVFGGFVGYQVYRFTLTGGFGLVALSVFDLIVIWFIWLEYRATKFRRSTD